MRRYFLYIVIIMQILLIISLLKGLVLSKKSEVRINDLKQTKAKLEDERDKLKKEEEYVKSTYYLEKVAREELHLSKAGETVVIIPQEMMEDNEHVEVKAVPNEVKANWQKWWEVLSGKI